MKSVRFSQRLLVVVGCFGLLIAAVNAQPGPPGTGGLTQDKAICKKQACEKVASVVGHANCPYPVGGDIRGSCMFDLSKGDLIWCDASDAKCTISNVNGIEKSFCVGYCETMHSLTCDTTHFSKCVIAP